MTDRIPERSTPHWHILDRVRPSGATDLARLSDQELLDGYERAQRLEALRAEAESVDVPPEIAAAVEAMSDDELLAAWQELTA